MSALLFEPLQLPYFARLTDYVGAWALESAAAAHLFRLARSMDMAAHLAELSHQNEPIKSALEKTPAGDGKSIALVRLTGLLMKGASSLGGTSTVQARRDIRQATADPDVGGIVLAIDSPGGTVAGTDALAQDVKAARAQKPVITHIDDTGASAAYWAGVNATRIYASGPTAMVGSIGTYQVIQDLSAAAEKEGVRTLVFATGHLKGLGVPGTKVTDEQAAHVQSLVNGVHGSFRSAVQEGRHLSDQQIMEVSHGGAMTATAAKAAKLIDGIQPLSQTMDEMMRLMKKKMPMQPGMIGGLPMLGVDLDILLVFTHNSDTAKSEPDWGSVDKTALPMLAFADHGDGADKKSSWSYPHHFVQNAGGKDDNGVWTTGDLLLHTGGLAAAWSAAMGGRSGQKASPAVIAHLAAHRKALGLDKTQSLGGLPMRMRG